MPGHAVGLSFIGLSKNVSELGNRLERGEGCGVRTADLALGQNDRGGLSENDCGSCEAKRCELLKVSVLPRRRPLGRAERLSGGPSFKVWTVLSGLVALCTTLPDGRRQIVSLSAAGEVACSVSAPGGTEVWIEALTSSALCELDFGPRDRSRLALDVAASAELFRIVSGQVKALSAHLVTLGRLNGMERVYLFLADMAWRQDCETPEGWRVRLPMSRVDIADYLGLNPETVSRIFGRAKKARLVTFLSPTEILVPDLEALQERAPLVPAGAPPNASPARSGPVARELRLI